MVWMAVARRWCSSEAAKKGGQKSKPVVIYTGGHADVIRTLKRCVVQAVVT
jgi:hypothetical protein